MSKGPEKAEELAKLADKYNIASGYTTHMADRRSSPGLTALVDRVTQGGNHVFFGEPHFDGAMVRQYELLANNPDMFKAASQNGVKHLALEIPVQLQGYVDDFTAGKTTRQQFMEDMKRLDTPWAQGDANQAFRESITKTVENARRAGMKIHFADVKANDDLANLYPPNVMALEKEMLAKHLKEKPDMPQDQYLAQELAKMPDEKREQLKRDIEDHQEKWRINRFDDTAQYTHLRERIPQNEAIMGVVGLAHLNNGMDNVAGRKIMGVDDYLEAEGKKVTSIELQTQNSRGYTQELATMPGQRPNDPPDYVIRLDTRTIEDKNGVTAGLLDQKRDSMMADNRRPASPQFTPTALTQ